MNGANAMVYAMVYASIKWHADNVTEDVWFGIGEHTGEDDDTVFYWLDSKDEAVVGFDNGEWAITQVIAYRN